MVGFSAFAAGDISVCVKVEVGLIVIVLIGMGSCSFVVPLQANSNIQLRVRNIKTIFLIS